MAILIQGLTSHLNEEVVGPTASNMGHECLLLMMFYDSTSQWVTVRQDQSLTSWDINGASMKYLSSDPQVLIPWPTTCQVPPKGHHKWIRHKKYLQVHRPRMKRRRLVMVVSMAPGSCEGTRTDPVMGRNPSPLAYKKQLMLHKEALLVRRTISSIGPLSWPEEQLLLANTPKLAIPTLWALRSSSSILIKQTLIYNGCRVLQSGDPNQYKYLCSSWCSSQPLLQDSTLFSILVGYNIFFI
jgi:hypothetical protein